VFGEPQQPLQGWLVFLGQISVKIRFADPSDTLGIGADMAVGNAQTYKGW